jgi:hypothetical protein
LRHAGRAEAVPTDAAPATAALSRKQAVGLQTKQQAWH